MRKQRNLIDFIQAQFLQNVFLGLACATGQVGRACVSALLLVMLSPLKPANATTHRQLVGDIFEVRGHPGKSKVGELTVFAHGARLLSPCLHVQSKHCIPSRPFVSKYDVAKHLVLTCVLLSDPSTKPQTHVFCYRILAPNHRRMCFAIGS